MNATFTAHPRRVPGGPDRDVCRSAALEDLEYLAKLDQLDHLLNDPEIDAEPAQIWSLLAEVSHHDLSSVRVSQGAPAR